MKKLSICVVFFVIIICSVNFWLWAMYDNATDLLFYKIPHRINCEESIVYMDDKGYIYVGDLTNGKLQIYDKNGRFHYGIAIPDSYDGFYFAVETSDILIKTSQNYYIVKEYKEYIRPSEIIAIQNINKRINMFEGKLYKLNDNYSIQLDEGLSVFLKPVHIFPFSFFWTFLFMFISLVWLMYMNKGLRELIFRKSW